MPLTGGERWEPVEVAWGVLEQEVGAWLEEAEALGLFGLLLLWVLGLTLASLLLPWHAFVAPI